MAPLLLFIVTPHTAHEALTRRRGSGDGGGGGGSRIGDSSNASSDGSPQVRVRLARDQLSYRPALQHFSQLCGTAAVGSSGFPGERPRLLSEMPSFYFDVQGGKGGARPKRDARRFLYGRGAHRAPLKHVYVQQQPNSRGRPRRRTHTLSAPQCGTRAPAAGVVEWRGEREA